MKRLYYLLTASLCFLTCLVYNLSGQNYQTVMNGDWFDPAVWGGIAAPVSADSVIVSHDIHFNADITLNCSYMKLDSGSFLSGVTLGPDYSFTVTSDEWINYFGEIGARVFTANTLGKLYNWGAIGADSIIMQSFENFGWMGCNYMFFDGTPPAINDSVITTKYLTWTGTFLNNLYAFGINEGEGYLVTGDTLINNGLIATVNWIHNTYSIGDSTATTCVLGDLMNTGTITGAQDICDYSLGGSGDINTGTISTTVTFCNTSPEICHSLHNARAVSFAMQVFPSPASEVVHLRFTKMVQGNISLVSVDAKEVLQTPIQGKDVLLNVEGLPPGLYVLRVVSEEGNLVKKIVVQ